MWVPKKTTREKRVEINFAPEIVVNDSMMISSFSEIWRRCPPSLSNVPLLFLVFSLPLFVFALISSKQTSSYVCSCSSSSRMISLIQNCNPKKNRKRKKQSNQFLAFSCCVGENHKFRTKISWSAAAPEKRLSFLALLLTNFLSCNEEASSIFNQSPGWQKTWENRTTTKLLVNATQKKPKLQATTSMQSGLHEHETAPQQQQLVDCLCKTRSFVPEFYPTPGEALSLSLSLSLHNLLLCNNKMGLGEISKWAKWVFFW